MNTCSTCELLAEKVCDECDNTGWIYNRVEGKAPCGCLWEMGNYAQLHDVAQAARAFIAQWGEPHDEFEACLEPCYICELISAVKALNEVT